MMAPKRPREERGTDFFRTPSDVVRAIVPMLSGPVLDPCAGDGGILEALAIAGVKGLRGYEIVPELAAASSVPVDVRDSLAEDSWCWAGKTVVMNPPFLHAEAFVRRAIAEVAAVHDPWAVWALLPLGFLGSGRRRALHREHPSDVHVLSRRPSFCVSLSCPEEKCDWSARISPALERPRECPRCVAKLVVVTTDATDYAWFHWSANTRDRRIHDCELPELPKKARSPRAPRAPKGEVTP